MRPRIRTVKPEMRQDERYARLSYPARELFNGLITMADDEGRFRAPASAILGHIFPYDEDAPRKLRTWIGEVRDSGMVLFYVHDEVPYGAFRHWRRHQKVNRAQESVLPPPPDHGVITENSVNAHDLITDRSVNDHGVITDRASPHAQARVPIRSCSNGRDESLEENHARAEELCHLLAERICENDPKANPKPESATWIRDMRLLLTDRGGAAEEVREIIEWCQRDGFWRSNILSPGKLRKQFTQLRLKMQAPTKESASDLLKAINGGLS